MDEKIIFCENLNKYLNNQPKLSDVAIHELLRLVKIIEFIDALDYPLFYEYVRLHSDILETEKLVQQEGELLTSDRTGNSYINPRTSLLINKRNQLRRLRDELRMSPKSRASKTERKAASLSDLIK